MPDQAGVMVAGVVRDDMDPLVAGIAGLQLLKQRDGGSGHRPARPRPGARSVFQLGRGVEVEARASRGPLQRPLVALPDPGAGRDWHSGCMASAKQTASSAARPPCNGSWVAIKAACLDLIGPGRQAFRALIFEAQAMQQLQTARMSVNNRPGRRDTRPPPLPCRASAVRSAKLKAPSLVTGPNGRAAPARRTASSRPGRQPR